MQDFAQKKILLGVCGGIAAYKAAYLARELVRLGAVVQVVMTASAEAFITPLTFQALTGRAPRTDLWDKEAEAAMGHIELARWADYLVIAPASANTLAAMAQGLANDLLTTLYLAIERPVFVCPAMNRAMWAHPATAANCQILAQRGVRFIGPDTGLQACGEDGPGRMVEPLALIDALRVDQAYQQLRGKKVLITAGPTREGIDPVRYLSNHSSGKMGYAMAVAAVAAGATVTLITGPTALPWPIGATVVPVVSAKAMHAAVLAHLEPGMIVIAVAAVADFGLEEVAVEKIKRDKAANLSLTFTPNPDIVKAVVASKKAAFVVGFAAETHDCLAHAKEKLAAKQVDMMIANSVGPGLGFEEASNAVTILTKDDAVVLPLMHKMRLAARLLTHIAAQLHDTCHTKKEDHATNSTENS